jgi:hypothetical protein
MHPSKVFAFLLPAAMAVPVIKNGITLVKDDINTLIPRQCLFSLQTPFYVQRSKYSYTIPFTDYT